MRSAAFIFDMDGTLVDNMRVHDQVWVELLAGAGVSVESEQFYRQAAGKTNPEILRQFLGEHLTDEIIAEHAERKESLYRERYGPDLKALDGLRNFLDSARDSGIPMALATSSGPGNIEFVLEGLTLRSYFDVIVNGQQVKRGKPHPEIFLNAAAQMGVEPRRCVVFEDAPSGIEAARRAEMHIVVMTTRLSPEEVAGQKSILAAAQDFTNLDPARLISSVKEFRLEEASER